MNTLWGETVRRSRRQHNRQIRTSTIPYSITGNFDDCQVIGHTLNHWSLAGTTTCMVCGARIFCPGCTPKHPQDENALPELCERHEQESQVNHVI